MLTKDDGAELIGIARKAVTSDLSRKEFVLSPEVRARYSKKQGAFVTITSDHELRGCIGYPEPVLPLIDAIVAGAKAAAFHDPRFPPVGQKELPRLKFEISVLTVPELIKVSNPQEYLTEVKVGRDGLIVHNRGCSGLLLPQVATEHSWNPEEFLRNTCTKAGLPGSAWQQEGCKVYKFQAQVFSEA